LVVPSFGTATKRFANSAVSTAASVGPGAYNYEINKIQKKYKQYTPHK
jgi:hypothetical protein